MARGIIMTKNRMNDAMPIARAVSDRSAAIMVIRKLELCDDGKRR
jgi:hypothetical protein